MQNLKTSHRKAGGQKKRKKERERKRVITLGHQVKSEHYHSVDLTLKIILNIFRI